MVQMRWARSSSGTFYLSRLAVLICLPAIWSSFEVIFFSGCLVLVFYEVTFLQGCLLYEALFLWFGLPLRLSYECVSLWGRFRVRSSACKFIFLSNYVRFIAYYYFSGWGRCSGVRWVNGVEDYRIRLNSAKFQLKLELSLAIDWIDRQVIYRQAWKWMFSRIQIGIAKLLNCKFSSLSWQQLEYYRPKCYINVRTQDLL